MQIAIVAQIDLGSVYTLLQSPEAGGIALFAGTVRNHAQGKEVRRLVFEAYEPMALSEMAKIAAQAGARWPLEEVVMLHVLGERRVGETVVAVGAASAHREAAFAACQFLIDALKRTVPIWKQEFYTDSSVWVSAHP